MNRKRVRRISLIVVLFLALGALWTALQGGPKSREHAAALFQKNRSAFDSAAAQAVERVGMPEAQIILAQAVTYVASAPKSNAACSAYHAAMEDAKNVRDDDGVPAYLKDNTFGDAKTRAQSAKYKYPHNYAEGYVEQQYLPEKLKNRVYYIPKDIGFEKTVKEIRRQKE